LIVALIRAFPPARRDKTSYAFCTFFGARVFLKNNRAPGVVAAIDYPRFFVELFVSRYHGTDDNRRGNGRTVTPGRTNKRRTDVHRFRRDGRRHAISYYFTDPARPFGFRYKVPQLSRASSKVGSEIRRRQVFT